MEAWQVILLILMLLSFVFSLTFFTIFSHALEFKSSLKKRMRALGTLAAEKQRLLRLLYQTLKRERVELRRADEQAVQAALQVDCNALNDENAKAELDKLNSASSHLTYVIQSDSVLEAKEEIQELLDYLKQNERFVRQGMTGYNMDVSALNYWISIPFVGWTTYLLGLRKQKPIA